MRAETAIKRPEARRTTERSVASGANAFRLIKLPRIERTAFPLNVEALEVSADQHANNGLSTI